jgi:hypothetical protein
MAEPRGSEPGTSREELGRLDALEHDLEVSEQRLEEHLSSVLEPGPTSEGSDGVTGDSAAMDEGAAEAEAPAAPAPAPPTAEPRSAREKQERQERRRADDVCSLSCRALASMRRAAEGICELLPASPRCGSATERVDRARLRVENVGCQCTP